MKKPTKRSIVIAVGASALVLGGAVAAVGSEALDPNAIDPSKTEVTVTDESFTSDGVLISTTVTTYDVDGNVLETSTTTP